MINLYEILLLIKILKNHSLSNIFADFESHLEIYKNEINRLTQENAQGQQLIQSLQTELKRLKKSEVGKSD